MQETQRVSHTITVVSVFVGSLISLVVLAQERVSAARGVPISIYKIVGILRGRSNPVNQWVGRNVRVPARFRRPPDCEQNRRGVVDKLLRRAAAASGIAFHQQIIDWQRLVRVIAEIGCSPIPMQRLPRKRVAC